MYIHRYVLHTDFRWVMLVSCFVVCLLLSLQDVSVCERDSQGAIANLSRASEYAALIKADYPRLLSLLSQGAVSACWRGGGGREWERRGKEGGREREEREEGREGRDVRHM